MSLVKTDHFGSLYLLLSGAGQAQLDWFVLLLVRELDRRCYTQTLLKRWAILIKREKGMGRPQHDHLSPAHQPLSDMGISTPGFGKGQGSFIHIHGLAKLTDFA